MRETRFRGGDAGAPIGKKDRETFVGRQIAFMKKRHLETQGAPAAKRARKKAELQREPRLATYDWLVKLNNACVGGLGFGLEAWQPQDPQRAWNDPLREGEDIGGAFVCLMDQEAKQWCGAHFLKYKLGHQSEFLIGPQHRRANDVDRALNRAGVYGVCLIYLVLNNLPYGSWQGSKNYKDLIDTAMEIEVVDDPDCPILRRFWPGICSDHGWERPEEQDRAARARFVREFSLRRPFEAKGLKAATSRWFSILQGMRLKDEEYHTFLYAAVTLAVQQGWNSCWEDLVDGGIPSVAAGAQSSGADGNGASSSAVVAQAGAAAGVAKVQPKSSVANSKAKAKTASRADLQRVYAKSVNMMHAATRLMLQPEVLHHGRIIIMAAKALDREHSACTSGLRSRDECIDWFARMANGEWLDTMRDTVGCLQDLGALSRAGFTTNFTASLRDTCSPTDDAVLSEDTLAGTLWRVVLCLLSERCSTMMRYVGSYPYKWAGVLSKNASRAESALNDCEADWLAYEEAHSINLPVVKVLVRHSSLVGRVTEDTARLARSQAWQPSEALRSRLASIFGCWANEKLAEDALKVIRESEQRDATSKEVRQWRVWERPVGQQLLATYKRDELEPSVSVPTGAPHSTGSLFGITAVAPPDVAMDLKRVTGMQDWQSWSPDHLKQQAIDHSLLQLMASSGHWEVAADVWRCAAIPPLQVILHRPSEGEHSIFLCLHACPTGVLCWPVVRLGEDHILPDLGATALGIKHFSSLDDLFVVPATPISPLHAYLLGTCPLSRLGVIVKHEQPVQLVEWQAARGFPGVGETILKGLAGDWGVEVPELQHGDPDMETMLALRLTVELLPDLPEPEVIAALDARAKHQTGAHDFLLEAISSDDIADVATPSDTKAMKDRTKAFKHAKETRDGLRPKVLQAVRTYFQSQQRQRPKRCPAAIAASKLKLASLGGRSRWWNSIVGDIDFVRKWSPPGARTVCDERNGRFLMHYRDHDRRSISWTKRGVQAAALETLRMYWQWHEEATGEGPPVPLEQMGLTT